MGLGFTLPDPVRRGPLLAAVGALALLAGCGTTGGTKTVTVRAGATAPADATPTGAGPAPTTARTPTRTDTVIARRTGTVNNTPVVLEIVEFKRSRATVALSIRLSTKSSNGPLIDETFDDGINQKSRSRGVPDKAGTDTLDGIYLIDGAHGRRYLVARDRENNCVCDHDLYHQDLAPGQPASLSAIFGAPPPSVKAVDVFIPRFGTFKDLPLG